VACDPGWVAPLGRLPRQPTLADHAARLVVAGVVGLLVRGQPATSTIAKVSTGG
jgi:hypothetical protein